MENKIFTTKMEIWISHFKHNFKFSWTENDSIFFGFLITGRRRGRLVAMKNKISHSNPVQKAKTFSKNSSKAIVNYLRDIRDDMKLKMRRRQDKSK